MFREKRHAPWELRPWEDTNVFHERTCGMNNPVKETVVMGSHRSRVAFHVDIDPGVRGFRRLEVQLMWNISFAIQRELSKSKHGRALFGTSVRDTMRLVNWENLSDLLEYNERTEVIGAYGIVVIGQTASEESN